MPPRRIAPASDDPIVSRLPLDWPWIRERLAAGSETDHQALRIHCAIRASSRWRELYDDIVQGRVSQDYQ